MTHTKFIAAILIATALSPAAFAQTPDVNSPGINSHGTETISTTVGGPNGVYTETESVKTKNGVVVDHDVSTAGDPSVAATTTIDTGAAIDGVPAPAIVPDVTAAIPDLSPTEMPPIAGDAAITGGEHIEHVTTTKRIKGAAGEQVITDTVHVEKKAP
ncbi:MAG: hypothetical protein JWM96_668 [Alphaproteobacteria bacterium]|nr:hypothetical protein [Alphaproteobacteria bacterium]